MSELREMSGRNSSGAAPDVELPQVHLRINGKKVLSRSGESWEHVNPVTGQVDATIPLADGAAVDDAVRDAHAAFDGWRRTPPSRRRELLLKLADLIEQHSEEIVRVGTAENGRRAHRIASELETGEVLINGAPNLAVHRPFGGIGISGVGKEGGRAGFEEFLRVKSVAISIH